jgi:hypothetical protein
MVENNQVYESAPTDLEDTESNDRGRGFASKAALTIAGGVAMASGMLMGNQMIVPALLGGIDGQGNVQVLNGNGVDAASASELTTSDKALFGNAESESVFSIKAGTAFHNSAFGASDSQIAAAVAAAATTAATPGASVSTASATTQTSTDPAGTTGNTVIVAPVPTWDTTATNTSSATTVAGGGAGTGASGSTGGSYGDDGDDENEDTEDHHDGHHEDHEDNDD